MKTRLIQISAAFLLASLGIAAEVTLLHSSDVHGRLDPVKSCGKENQGGLAKRASFVKDMREQENNLLVLDSGDYFQGTIYYDLYGGKESARLMPHAGIDAMALGNHEFNADEAGLRELMQLANTPFLCANIDFSDDYLKQQVKPYIIKEVEGEKILIIGVTTPDLMSMTKSRSIKVHDAAPIVQKIAEEVEHDYLIVLSHCGYAYDKKMLSQSPAIDLILGGHDHYSLMYQSPDGAIIHNGCYGTQVGVLRIDTEKKSVEAQLVPMDEDIAHDENIDKEMQVINARVDALKAQKVAHAAITIQGEEKEIESQQTNLGQLVLKSMSTAFYDFDAVIVQAGSIRIYRDLQGDISYTDVMQILPFKGMLVCGQLRGSELKSILKKGEKSGEGYLHYYLKESRIEDEKLYRVITNDYLGAGKDGYEEFLQMQNTETSMQDCFEILYQFLKENPHISEQTLQL